MRDIVCGCSTIMTLYLVKLMLILGRTILGSIFHLSVLVFADLTLLLVSIGMIIFDFGRYTAFVPNYIHFGDTWFLVIKCLLKHLNTVMTLEIRLE